MSNFDTMWFTFLFVVSVMFIHNELTQISAELKTISTTMITQIDNAKWEKRFSR